MIELLLSASILSVVLLAILALLDTTARSTPQDQERAHAIQDAQAGLYRMTREIRQADAIVSGDADTIVINVVVSGTNQQITWECATPHPTESAYRRCTRQVGAGTTEVVVDRVVNGPSRAVFEYDTPAAANARYVRANVIVPARGDRKTGEGHKHEVFLHDGLYLRNRDA